MTRAIGGALAGVVGCAVPIREVLTVDEGASSPARCALRSASLMPSRRPEPRRGKPRRYVGPSTEPSEVRQYYRHIESGGPSPPSLVEKSIVIPMNMVSTSPLYSDSNKPEASNKNT